MRRRLITGGAIVVLLGGAAVGLWLNKRAIVAKDEARAALRAAVESTYTKELAAPLAAHADDPLPERAPVAIPILPIETNDGLDTAEPEGWLDGRLAGPRRADSVAAARTFAVVHVDYSLYYTGAPGTMGIGLITAVTVTLFDRAYGVPVCRKSFRRDHPPTPVTDAQLDVFRVAFWGDVATYLDGLPSE